MDENSERPTVNSKWVRLNIGGTIFETTSTTLNKEPNGFLSRMVMGDPDLPSCKDMSGAYLIDRDPHYFSPVLNFLRHGKLILEKNISEEGVLEEAEFYNLPTLVQRINEVITQRDLHLTKAKKAKVYRVLQCQEKELADTISNISDGWRFEQLLIMGSNYSYGPEEHPEYLYVVSKDVAGMSDSASGNESTSATRVNNKVLQWRSNRP